LREWGEVSARRNLPVMLDQASSPWFVELNRSLRANLDDTAFRAHIQAAHARLRRLARELLTRGSSEHPALNGSPLRALLGDDAEADALALRDPLLFPSASAWAEAQA
jgi:hypothetical protein